MLGDTLVRASDFVGLESRSNIYAFVEFDCDHNWVVDGEKLRNKDLKLAIRKGTLTAFDHTLDLASMTAYRSPNHLTLRDASGASFTIDNVTDAALARRKAAIAADQEEASEFASEEEEDAYYDALIRNCEALTISLEHHLASLTSTQLTSLCDPAVNEAIVHMMSHRASASDNPAEAFADAPRIKLPYRADEPNSDHSFATPATIFLDELNDIGLDVTLRGSFIDGIATIQTISIPDDLLIGEDAANKFAQSVYQTNVEIADDEGLDFDEDEECDHEDVDTVNAFAEATTWNDTVTIDNIGPVEIAKALTYANGQFRILHVAINEEFGFASQSNDGSTFYFNGACVTLG